MTLQDRLGRLSASDHWMTPPGVLRRVEAMAGPSGIYDPCPSSPSEDGLEVDWRLRAVPPGADKALIYVNPPYSRGPLREWAAKCAFEGSRGCDIVALLPASVGARWWVEHIWGAADALVFVSGRLRFHAPETGQAAGCGRFWSALVLWGPDRMEAFYEHLGPLGEGARLRVQNSSGGANGQR